MPDPAFLLLSYSKSGRTWTRFALGSLFIRHFNLDIELDFHTMFDLTPAYEESKDHPRRPECVPWIAPSHERWNPEWVGIPVIWVMRDPLDATVSYYYHLERHDPKNSMPTFYNFCDQNINAMADWFTNIASHLPERHMFVRYEAMHADLGHQLRRICDFIGLAPSDAHIEDAVRESSFERMQVIEKIRGMRRPVKYDRDDPDALRIRRGRIGSWREHMDDERGAILMERFLGRMSPEARLIYMEDADEACLPRMGA